MVPAVDDPLGLKLMIVDWPIWIGSLMSNGSPGTTGVTPGQMPNVTPGNRRSRRSSVLMGGSTRG